MPCANGATCLPDSQNESYKCVCKEQYMGRQCETIINACSSNPCTAGATCIVYGEDTSQDFMCKCPIGRTGKLCDDCKPYILSYNSLSNYPIIWIDLDQLTNFIKFSAKRNVRGQST